MESQYWSRGKHKDEDKGRQTVRYRPQPQPFVLLRGGVELGVKGWAEPQEKGVEKVRI